MLKQLSNDQIAIVRIADTLKIYRHQAKQLAELIAQCYLDERAKLGLAEKRLLYFYVANETIFRTKDEGYEYVKAFGDLLSDWVDIFANACEDYFCLDNLQKLIKLWEDEQIFAKTFCELLYSYLRPRIESARSKLQHNQNFELQAQERLQKQLNTINQCELAREALQLDLRVQNDQVAKRVRTLTDQVFRLEKLAGDGNPIDRKAQLEPIKRELLELKKQESDTLIQSMELMYKMSLCVEQERQALKELTEKQTSKMQELRSKVKIIEQQ